MCNLESLIPTVFVLGLVKMGVGLYILVAGAMMIESIPIQMAYSINFVDIGGSLVALGLFSLLSSFPLIYAVRKHNRFLLIVVFCLDTIFMGQLLNLGVRILRYTHVKFDKELQVDCLQSVPMTYSAEECKAFREDDRTAGFRLIWTYLFTVRTDPTQFQTIEQIQSQAECCGFFSPMIEGTPETGCQPIDLPLPDAHPVEVIPSKWTQSKLFCGAYPGFYMEYPECISYYDVTVAPPIVGGCNYDLGVGPCLLDDVFPNSIGCASAVEDYSATLIVGSGYGMITCAFFNFLAMFISCCVWWKRKADDVFPDFLREEKVDTVDYHKVRDQFVVKPQEHYLQLHGYNPTDERASNFSFVKYVKHDEFVPKGAPKFEADPNDSNERGGETKEVTLDEDGNPASAFAEDENQSTSNSKSGVKSKPNIGEENNESISVAESKAASGVSGNSGSGNGDDEEESN